MHGVILIAVFTPTKLYHATQTPLPWIRRIGRDIAPVVQAAHTANLRVLEETGELKTALALHFAYYNFCRVHGKLRVTPAMEAGLTDHVWSLKELL
jgi:hypothetical protein